MNNGILIALTEHQVKRRSEKKREYYNQVLCREIESRLISQAIDNDKTHVENHSLKMYMFI